MMMPASAAATSTDAVAPAKRHYVILDGLRGVASLLVIVFHLFEAYADNNPQKQIINHGYLAVDFFFLLSGFVIAYAYDDRWGRMGQWEFYKRRLIRLQPMVVLGSVLVAVSAIALVLLLVIGKRGDLIGGWSLDTDGLTMGFTRVMFPFFAGVLLMRLGKRIRLPGAFWLCSLMLIVALSLPRFGGTERLWVNGLYEAGCVIVLFPLIVAIGAGEKTIDGPSVLVARFFGDLSYPLYITHYPLIYIYTGWVIDRKVPPWQGALAGVGVSIVAVGVAYASLKLFDEPARRWLALRLLTRRT